MTLLITVFAAIIATIVWYNDKENKKRLGILSLMYWGASLMWLVDAAAEYLKIGAAYFTPEAADMLNDTFLGLSVVALGLVIWLIVFLIKDPSGRLRCLLKRAE